MRASSSIGLAILSLASLLWLACSDPVPPSDDDLGGPDPANRCGNGVVEDGEFCDAGGANNNIVPNACRLDCTLPYCGDGVRDDSEECDLGDQNGGDECTQECISLVADMTTTDVTTTDETTTSETDTNTDTDVGTTTTTETTAAETTAAETTGDDTTGDDTTAGTTTGGASG